MRTCKLFLPVTVACVTTWAYGVDELAENFTPPELGEWGGGSEVYENPGADGVGGASDGYLRVGNLVVANRLATRNISLPYIGDYPTEGVRHVMFYLNDTGAVDEQLELYFGIGQGPGNYWLRNEPLNIGQGAWAFNVIDIENADFTEWTQIGFGGTDATAFATALATVERVLIRYDDTSDGFDMLLFNDDLTLADFGVDRFIIAKDCDPAVITGEDCNDNGVTDECDIAFGTSLDENADGIPDECGGLLGDFDGDGDVDTVDLLQLLGAWGKCPGCPEDLTGDGAVTTNDLLILLGNWS